MFSWFVTRNGRIFTYSSVGIITASIFGAHFAIHGPLIDKYRAVAQLYRKKAPKPVHPDLLSEAKDVLNACTLDEKQKEKISFFNTVGLEVCHAGGYNSPWGAIIGLPLTFEPNAKIKIRDLKIVGKEDVDWAIEGCDILENCRLSNDAQKFAIAREIYSADIFHPLQNGAIAAFCFYFPAILAKKYNQKYETFKNPLRRRILTYTTLYALGFITFKSMKDPLKHLADVNCDKMAAELGPDYLKGGIEYYTKALKRNKELRRIMGDKGNAEFTAEGNQNYYIFTPKLPITKRLELLKKMEQSQT